MVNYNKVESTKDVELRQKGCYTKPKERGIDERFWTFFHQDWYDTVLYRKTKHVVSVQWFHFDYMRKKKDASFNRIIEACDFRGITNLLQFHYNWNQEIISEFYSTLFFDKKERIFMWMTNGWRFNIKLTQFAKIVGLSSHLDNPRKLHTRRVMNTREMTPMYDPNSEFHAPKIEGILPHFVVLHRMRRMLAPRIGDSDTILAYERNLHDAIMKNEHFDAFDYIINEIWNIAINPQRSCGFSPYIMCMIEVVAHERLYKDVAHEPLHTTVLKPPVRHHTSPPLDVAPARTTHSGGASSPSSNSSFLKIFRGIFAMCRCTYQCMDVIEHCINILYRNQEIIHNQRNDPLIEFLEEPVYPPIPSPYALLTLAELAAFGIGPSHAPTVDNYGDDNDEEEANDDKEIEDDE
jgi:hypothetical protein